jgi:hypothetical protein
MKMDTLLTRKGGINDLNPQVECAKAWDAKEIEWYGVDAQPNFPISEYVNHPVVGPIAAAIKAGERPYGLYGKI